MDPTEISQQNSKPKHVRVNVLTRSLQEILSVTGLLQFNTYVPQIPLKNQLSWKYSFNLGRAPVFFSATGCQHFLISRQLHHLTGAKSKRFVLLVAFTVESMSAFFNTTCTTASHVTSEGGAKKWGTDLKI